MANFSFLKDGRKLEVWEGKENVHIPGDINEIGVLTDFFSGEELEKKRIEIKQHYKQQYDLRRQNKTNKQSILKEDAVKPEIINQVKPPATSTKKERKVNPVLSEIQTPGALYFKDIETEFFNQTESINMGLYELTEDDAGRLFVDVYYDFFRYNTTSKGWMVWASNRFTPDKWNLAERAAALIAKHIQIKMIDMDVENLKDAANFVKKIRSSSGIRAILFFASADPRVVTSQEDYDKNPHLINTPLGVYEHLTGVLRNHRRDDLMTKVTAYAPDANFKPVYFLDFLNKITLGRKDLQEGLQRYLGSGCSGKYPKDNIGLFQGGGGNGKTVLIESVTDVLGDYSGTLDIKYLTSQDKFNNSGHNDELASTTGKRLVVSVESQEGKNFHEGNIKKFTGGDGFPVSFKHGHTFTIHPAFTLVILTNHKPKVTGRDKGIWRRLRFFPFEYTIPESEKDLDFKIKMLETDGAYIMHWLLEGCRKWYKEGYGTFETIEQATDQYKNDEDVLGNFINECCKLDKGFSIQANRLRTAFEKWCNENGEHIFSGRAWRQALEERGFARSHGMYGKTWKGLTLMEEYNNDAIPF